MLNDPALRSWVAVPNCSDFPIQNLPFGAFMRASERPRLGIAIGDDVLDLRMLAEAGLLDGVCTEPHAVFCVETLNALLARGRTTWRAARERVSSLLRSGDRRIHDAGLADAALIARRAVRTALPIAVGDYVDFYSSLEHATNVGRILRPQGEPLARNWRYLPVAYHGRAGSVVPSGTPVARPRGQILADTAAAPVYAPTRSLDFELELAFVTGDGPRPAAPIDPEHARETIFGVALMNDWSARDVQTWEYQPLGPFLSKSFATSLGPWLVTLDALEPYRVSSPQQAPPPLPHLAGGGDGAYDVTFEIALSSSAMRERERAECVVARSNFRGMYWTMAQQLAHATSNGAAVRAGDLFGSGTISGDAPGSYGSMLEIAWSGERPLRLPDETLRTFLEDGDEVVMRGWCEGNGRARIGFGELRGRVLASAPS